VRLTRLARLSTVTATAVALLAGPTAAFADGPDAGDEGVFRTRSTPTISTTSVVVPMVFPVVGPTSYSDTFLACRSGCTRQHLGQDLMGPKMSPLVAAFTGVVSSIKRETTVGDGNYITLRGDNGWSANYLHVNNDMPGTDDGKGTVMWAIAPGLREGTHVFAGQLLGWRGDSGNAESTGPHLHFELRKGGDWSGVVYNAFPSLNAARRLTAPTTSGPHPDGVLLKSTAGGRLYKLENRRRRPIYPSVAANLRLDTRKIIYVTPDEMKFYPIGTAVPLRDGTVFRDELKRLWLVQDGHRIGLPSAADLAKTGVPETAIVAGDYWSRAANPMAEDQTVPGVVHEGAALRVGKSQTVYVIDGHQRHIAPNSSVLASWAIRGEDIRSVPDTTFTGEDELPVGAPLKLADGSMVRDGEGRTWLISGQRRHQLTSTRVREMYGYATYPVMTVATTTVAALPLGPTLPN
jgi:hypothetical protein